MLQVLQASTRMEMTESLSFRQPAAGGNCRQSAVCVRRSARRL
jgi:hypothetical protein